MTSAVPAPVRDALSAYGGPIEDLSSINQTLAKMFVLLTDSVRKGNPFIADGVHFHLVANDSFNAVATIRNDLDIAGIFVGTMTDLLQLMHNVLTNTDYWPHLDKAASPSSPTASTHSSERTRQLFAVESAYWALHFILAHELGHIARGHIRYLCRAFSESSLSELSYGRGRSVPCRILRAIEMDADTIATTSLVLSCLQQPHIESELARSDIIRARLFGAAAVFALIARHECTTCPTESLTHPKPHLRMLLVLQRVMKLGAESIPRERQLLEEAACDCLRELAKCFPDFWKGSPVTPNVIRTSELAELFSDIRRLEPEFITLADQRLGKYGHA